MASYTLHIQYVDRPAETRTFTQAKVTLGRDSGDIVLHDTQVSGKHGEITFDGNTLRYTDVGSTNGSFLLQGQRVANIELTPGIALRLGNSLITVQIIDAPNVAGKGRTVIAGPGMAPGFPAPMRPPGPAAPAASGLSASGSAIPRPGMPAPPSPPPGGFAFAPTAQMQSPMMPAGMPAAPAPQAFVPQPAPMAPPQPAPMAPPQPIAPMAQPIPPGPPPGTFSGGAPAPMPAAPMPAAPMAPAPIAAPPAAPVSATPQTLALANDPETDAPADFVGALKAAGLGAWNGIKDHIVAATSITLIVGLPIALLSWLVANSLDPTGSLSGLLQLVLRLAQLAGMLIVTPALVRFVLGVYLGQPVEWKATIREQVADAKTVALNFLIFIVIGGIAAIFLVLPMLFVIAFIGQIYFVEGKRKLDAISRNYEIVKRDWIPLAIHVFALAFVGALAFMIPAIILSKIHWTISVVGVIIAAVGSAVLTPIIMMLLTQMYFRNRRRFEGGDPEGDARVRLAAAPLPEA